MERRGEGADGCAKTPPKLSRPPARTVSSARTAGSANKHEHERERKRKQHGEPSKPQGRTRRTMKAVSRFEISLLILLMAEFYPDIRATSSLIGTVAGCNAVTVRNMYSKLKSAGLLGAKPGPHGLHLAKDPKDITLWDILAASEDMDAASVFSTQTPLSGTCSLGGNIHELLREHLDEALAAMQATLERTSLYDFAWKLPSTYEEPAEERLRIMHEALQGLAKQHAGTPCLAAECS